MCYKASMIWHIFTTCLYTTINYGKFKVDCAKMGINYGEYIKYVEFL